MVFLTIDCQLFLCGTLVATITVMVSLMRVLLMRDNIPHKAIRVKAITSDLRDDILSYFQIFS